MQNVWDSKNITLEFYDKVFYKWRIITQTQSEQLKTSSKKFFGGIYIYIIYLCPSIDILKILFNFTSFKIS